MFLGERIVMSNSNSKYRLEKKLENSGYQRVLEYENYIRQKKLATNQKIIFEYNDMYLGLTQKQINILKLVAKGLSNIKIAEELSLKDATVKLIIYRLTKYLERVLFERIDRFYLIIVAQKLQLDDQLRNTED